MAVIPDAKQPSIHLHNLKKSLVVILGLIAISVTAEADR